MAADHTPATVPAERLVARTRLILWVSLCVGLTFLALELAATPPQIAGPFFVKCAGVSVIVLGLWVLWSQWAVKHAQAVAAGVVAVAYVLTGASGMLSPSREYSTTAVLFVAAALSTAVILPWGLWPQVLTQLVGAGTLSLAVLVKDGNLAAAGSDPGTAVIIALILSGVTAREVQRYRSALLRELAARRRAELDVRALNADLERRVVERTSDLERANTQLRALSARLESVREEERTSVAREIHDELGQVLTALKLDLDLVRRQVDGAGNGAPTQPLGRKLAELAALSAAMIHCVRRICAQLRPALLDDLGLAAAIEWQGRDFERRYGIRCVMAVDPDFVQPDPARCTAIFRIVQEALTNVARHANATDVRVSLRNGDGRITVDVTDNGRGVTEAELRDPKSLGVLGIRERARLFGGEVVIDGRAGVGTTVQVQIPWDAREAPAPGLDRRQ
jgi:signal transduction histidine kinase